MVFAHISAVYEKSKREKVRRQKIEEKNRRKS
jgi:hypothetical protein